MTTRAEEAWRKNKCLFDRMHRHRPKEIKEGDWVLVYDNNLDNQHKVVQKFAKRWFGPYAVTSANDNGTYHLAELDGTRIVVPIVGKRIKVFKKWHEDELDPAGPDDGDGCTSADNDSENEG